MGQLQRAAQARQRHTKHAVQQPNLIRRNERGQRCYKLALRVQAAGNAANGLGGSDAGDAIWVLHCCSTGHASAVWRGAGCPRHNFPCMLVRIMLRNLQPCAAPQGRATTHCQVPLGAPHSCWFAWPPLLPISAYAADASPPLASAICKKVGGSGVRARRVWWRGLQSMTQFGGAAGDSRCPARAGRDSLSPIPTDSLHRQN